jgi:hypothetical protein
VSLLQSCLPVVSFTLLSFVCSYATLHKTCRPKKTQSVRATDSPVRKKALQERSLSGSSRHSNRENSSGKSTVQESVLKQPCSKVNNTVVPGGNDVGGDVGGGGLTSLHTRVLAILSIELCPQLMLVESPLPAFF